ncbi:MAG TPA: AIR synthase-related protein [Candidatus Paceibacterota bacterium]|nr:AIR synthase-related protein [Candidatus Paceibacterota bacterium]
MYNPIKPYKHEILRLIESTWRTPYITVSRAVYPTFTTHIRGKEIDHTDGIGTKGFYHWKTGTFHAAAIDALAMNLNDLALVRAVPYKLSNHITVPLEDERVLKIVRAITDICKAHKIAIVGGENSFHNNADGLDISMTVSGFVQDLKPNKMRTGDVLIGFKSNGLHSNGFSKVRKVFGNKMRKEFTQPTAIYLDTILKISERCDVHGMMHITGGAFAKLKDVLGGNDAVIQVPKSLKPQKIFYDLYDHHLPNRAMYTTFNCGIGFIVSCSEKDAKKICEFVPDAAVIGEVKKGSGKIAILSSFDGKTVLL